MKLRLNKNTVKASLGRSLKLNVAIFEGKAEWKAWQSYRLPCFLFIWLSSLVIFPVVFRLTVLCGPHVMYLFTGLMLVHVWLHCYRFPLKASGWQSELLYFGGQAGLVFVINLFAAAESPLEILYLPLLVEAVIHFAALPRLILVISAYLTVYLVNIIGLIGWQFGPLLAALVRFGGLVLLTVGFALIYMQRVRAYHRDQQLLHELEAAHSQIEALTLATERQRMARDLHDTLAQGLVGLVLQLETINAHLTNSQSERAREIVQISVSRARSTLAEARQAIDDLRKNAAGESDFFQLMRQVVAQFTATTDIECYLDVQPVTLNQLGLLPALVRECVLRGLNEGLTNIARYAQASWVSISLTLNPLKSGNRNWTLELKIEDNGVGLKSDDLKQLAATGHYGLVGLQERVQLLGGNLEVSRPKRIGTLLRLQLPIASGEQTI